MYNSPFNHQTQTHCKQMPTIFEEQISRKPNHYPWTEDFIESMHNGFWTDKEFSFKSDLHQFKTELTEQERENFSKLLSFVKEKKIKLKISSYSLFGLLFIIIISFFSLSEKVSMLKNCKVSMIVFSIIDIKFLISFFLFFRSITK